MATKWFLRKKGYIYNMMIHNMGIILIFFITGAFKIGSLEIIPPPSVKISLQLGCLSICRMKVSAFCVMAFIAVAVICYSKALSIGMII